MVGGVFSFLALYLVLMKILIASDNYPPALGGAETTTYNLAAGLLALGHEVAVIAPGGSWWQSRVVDEAGVRVLRLHSYPLPVSTKQRLGWWPRRATRRFLDDFAPDVVQCNNPSWTTWVVLNYARVHGIPSVIGNHVMPENYTFVIRRWPRVVRFLTPRLWRLLARFNNRATRLACPSQTTVDYLTRAGLNIEASVISNGVDLEATHPAKDVKAVRKELGLGEVPLVLYVGRISPEKRLDVLVRAAAMASTKAEFKVVMVGGSTVENTLPTLAHELGVEKRITFTGRVAAELKLKYLQAADVFVIPSPAELQSIVTLEAMACGKPVVAVNAGALPELVHPGKNGELFADGDATQLAGQILALLGDGDIRRRYGQAALATSAHHDIRQMPAHYLEVYENLVQTTEQKST